MKMRETSRAKDKKPQVNNNPKSEFHRQIAAKLGWQPFAIDCCLLKEGEIGGLPVTSETSSAVDELPKFLNNLAKAMEKQEATEEAYAKVLNTVKTEIMKVRNDRSKKVVTRYATHHTLAAIDEYLAANPDSHVLLMLDEFNRAENAVMQECMNLVLNREINGHKLHDNVHLLLCMNPTSQMLEYKEMIPEDYMTTDLDRAQLDRFRLFYLDASVDAWVNWATDVIDYSTGETRVDPDITEFIASNPDLLNNPKGTDDVTPSSRSWKRFSDTYKLYKQTKGAMPIDLYHICQGDLGRTVAVQFTSFLKDNANPLIKPEEIFIPEKVKQGNKNVTVYKELTEDQIKRIRGGNTYPRMMMVVKNCIRYVVQNKHNKAMAERLVDVICLLPKDLMTMVMMEIFHNQRKLHNILCDFDKYLDTFDPLDKLID